MQRRTPSVILSFWTLVLLPGSSVMDFGCIAVLQSVELHLVLKSVLMHGSCINLFGDAYVLSSTQELLSSKPFLSFFAVEVTTIVNCQ